MAWLYTVSSGMQGKAKIKNNRSIPDRMGDVGSCVWQRTIDRFDLRGLAGMRCDARARPVSVVIHVEDVNRRSFQFHPNGHPEKDLT